MELESFLAREKAAIVKRWFDSALEAYPPEAANLLKQKSQFANPVGHTLYYGLEGLYEEFLSGMDPEKVNHFMDRIVRVRAVQDFAPSQAIVFIFYLKKVIRQSVETEIREGRISCEELLAIEPKIDELALRAFDIYTSCREKLCELKVNEVKQRTYRLLQKADLLSEIPEWDPNKPEGGNT